MVIGFSGHAAWAVLKLAANAITAALTPNIFFNDMGKLPFSLAVEWDNPGGRLV